MSFDYRKFISNFFGDDAEIIDMYGERSPDGFFLDMRFYTWLSGSSTFDFKAEDDLVEDLLDDLCDYFNDNGFQDVDWNNLSGSNKGFEVTITGKLEGRNGELVKMYLSLPKDIQRELYSWSVSYAQGMDKITVFEKDIKKSQLDKLQKMGIITYGDEYTTSMGFTTWFVYPQPLLAEMLDAYHLS